MKKETVHEKIAKEAITELKNSRNLVRNKKTEEVDVFRQLIYEKAKKKEEDLKNKSLKELNKDDEVADYCSHCKKKVYLARSNWSLFRKIMYGPLFLLKTKNKCPICGEKLVEDYV